MSSSFHHFTLASISALPPPALSRVLWALLPPSACQGLLPSQSQGPAELCRSLSAVLEGLGMPCLCFLPPVDVPVGYGFLTASKPLQG